jgi:hypothetical protein
MAEDEDRTRMGDGPRPDFAAWSSTQCNDKDCTVPCEDVSNSPAETVNGRRLQTSWNAQRAVFNRQKFSGNIFPVTGMTFLLMENAPLCRRR